MAFNPHKRITELRKELRVLCAKRKFFEEKIVQVNLALNSLARGLEDEREREQVIKEIAAARRKPGLTERVAECLRDMPYAELSASEVRMWLEREGE